MIQAPPFFSIFMPLQAVARPLQNALPDQRPLPDLSLNLQHARRDFLLDLQSKNLQTSHGHDLVRYVELMQ